MSDLNLDDFKRRFDQEVKEKADFAALWQASRRQDLLHDVETELRARKLGADQAVREKQELAKAAEAERDGMSEVLRTSGGDQLDTAQRELRDVERRATEVERQRERLDAALKRHDLGYTLEDNLIEAGHDPEQAKEIADNARAESANIGALAAAAFRAGQDPTQVL